jgi:hypothetical protein
MKEIIFKGEVFKQYLQTKYFLNQQLQIINHGKVIQRSN